MAGGYHRLCAALTCFFIIFLLHEAFAASWQTGGPYGGNVSSLAISETNSEILYAGTPGGVFKTSDNGTAWKHKGPATFIELVKVDPTNPDIVYAGRYDGLYKSTNSGATWKYLGLSGVEILTIDPNNPNILYAGVKSFPQINISKSTDAENTWQTLITWDMQAST